MFLYEYELTYTWLVFIYLLFLPALGYYIHTYYRMQPPHAEGDSTLSISTTNTLSFLNVAYFLSGKLPNYRFHQNESQFQLDLQASTLVANLATTPELSIEVLHKL